MVWIKKGGSRVLSVHALMPSSVSECMESCKEDWQYVANYPSVHLLGWLVSLISKYLSGCFLFEYESVKT